MKLPDGMTTPQIRVLQEFRRKEQDELSKEEIEAITHPGGGGEGASEALVEKGFLTASPNGFILTDKSREFLARPSLPLAKDA